MNSETDNPLFSALRDSGRLSAEQLAAAEKAFATAGDDSGRLADLLMEVGCLTRYQHRKIQLGRTADLLFGHYLILERVGEGGMGKVYRAIELRLGRMVALKTIRPNLLTNKTVVSRYKREARAAASLKHPNIVELYEAEDVDGRYYLAMEFVEGMDLSRLTKELVKEKRTIAPAEAAEYIRQAALGIQNAHDMGLVHRDIKPSNLLVSGERAIPGTGGKAVVKILDMGLVRSLTEEDNTQMDLTRDGTVVGTPDYMSPEQAKNSSTVDYRADIYSLGCTLFYLLKGSPPYHEGTAIDKLIRHQLDPIPDIRQFRPDVPAGLAGVIRKMMAKKADDRFQTGADVAKELTLYTGEASTFNFGGGDVTEPFEYVNLAPNASGSVSRSNELAPPAATSGGRTVRPLAAQPGGQRTVRPVSTSPPPAAPQRVVQPVKPKPIGKATSDGTPSDSMPGGEAKRSDRGGQTPVGGNRTRRIVRRTSTRKAKPGFPVVPVAVVSAVVIVLIVIAAVIASRPGHTPPSGDSKLPESSDTAAAKGPVYRPITDLLPDHTAAVLITSPKRYREAGQEAEVKWPPALQKNFDFLAGYFKFDPWRFDRVVVAMQANPQKSVAVGEGDLLAKLDAFRKELDYLSLRFRIETDKNGVTLLMHPPVADKSSGERRARAALFPPPSAYLIGTDTTDLTDVYRGAGRKDPDGVDPKLLAAVVAATRPTAQSAPPVAFLAASGDWQVPRKGKKSGTPLRDDGVDLLTLAARFDQKQFHCDLAVYGRDGPRLKQFVQLELPSLIDAHVGGDDGTVLSNAIRAASDDAQPTDDSGRKRLSVSFIWPVDPVHAAVGKLLP